MRIKMLMMAILVSVTASAIPAMKRWITVTQSNGTTLKVRMVGDARRHYYVTEDGTPMRRAGKDFVKFNPDTVVFFREKVASRQGSLVTQSLTGAKRLAKAKKSSLYTGTKKGLVILANFSDRKFTMSNPKATYEAVINEKDYAGPFGTTGSVSDYFYDQSYGKFDIDFDVVGPVDLAHSYAYYGANDTVTYSGSTYYLSDFRAGQMIVEACKAAADSVDFSAYDWDGDGYVDQVFVLYAGYGEASHDDPDLIWPHEYDLQDCAVMETIDSIAHATTTSSSTGPGKPGGGSSVNEDAIYNYFLNYYSLKIDGDSINTYACSNEVYGYHNRDYLMGIGTICHEFSHCLGFPDLYDTVGSNYGMDAWDLMDYGSYNGPAGLGWKPAGYTSYERNLAGWLDYTELTDNDSIKQMPALVNSPVAYVIYNPGHTDEYYLLENRQKTSWDEYVPDSGLLVIHVDYNQAIWDDNMVNTIGSDGTVTNTHQRMTPIQADNSNSNIYDAYPYNSRDSLTDNSTPKARLYNANSDGTYYMHCRIMNITQNGDGTMAFNYNPMVSTGIGSVEISGEDEILSVYNLNGSRVSTTLDALPAGVYLLKMKSGSVRKVLVK